MDEISPSQRYHSLLTNHGDFPFSSHFILALMSSTKRDLPFPGEEDSPSKKKKEDAFVPLELLINDPNADHFIVNDLEGTALKGVVTQNTTIVNVLDNQNLLIIANNAAHSMVIYKKNWKYDVIPVDVSPTRLTELDDGDRIWEGAIWKGKPHGYGVMYYCGHREYEGYFYNGMKVCYGTEYYGLVEKVKYRGCFLQNERFGKGVLYNRYGGIRFDGYWLNNRPMSSLQEETCIHSHTEEMIIKEELSSIDSFHLGWCFASLRSLTIGNECLHDCPFFCISTLAQLQMLIIGNNSVYGRTKEYKELNDDELNCRIGNCPQLESIRIGNNSFQAYRRLYLNNLPKLRALEVGESSFVDSNSFELEGSIAKYFLFQISQNFKASLLVTAASRVVSAFHWMVLPISLFHIDLPKLESITMYDGAFNGEPEERTEVSIPEPSENCPRCGYRLEDVYCDRCGYEFPDPDDIEDSDPDPSDGEFKAIMKCTH